MTERWRWLDLDRQGPYENAATMPVLVRSVMTSGEPTAQTSVWGSTHLNVGWFDDVDSTVDLDLCAELGLEVVRRQFYGGGTAFYAAEAAMMWGFLLPKGYDAHGGSEGLDAQLRRFQTVISDALGRVGLAEVQFEGSSDLRWHGRKLGALTAQDVVGCDSIGGFLNLARPDLTTYLRGRAGARGQVQGQDRQGHVRVRVHRRGGRRPSRHVRRHARRHAWRRWPMPASNGCRPSSTTASARA